MWIIKWDLRRWDGKVLVFEVAFGSVDGLSCSTPPLLEVSVEEFPSFRGEDKAGNPSFWEFDEASLTDGGRPSPIKSETPPLLAAEDEISAALDPKVCFVLPVIKFGGRRLVIDVVVDFIASPFFGAGILF